MRSMRRAFAGNKKRRALGPPFVSMDCRSSPAMTVDTDLQNQLSRKLRSFLDRDGCFSFRSAFASI
jgi:hypothetical protein